MTTYRKVIKEFYGWINSKTIAYNDKSEALNYKEGQQLFIRQIAAQQLYYYSVIYETRDRLTFQINQYLSDILNK